MNLTTQETVPVPLGTVARFIRGITFKPDELIDGDADDAVACMRTKNVQVDLEQSDLLFVPSHLVKRDEQYLQSKDMLVSTANSWELVGKTSWVPELDYRATAGGFISILRAHADKVWPRYLYHWFTSARVQELVRNCGRKTTNISNLNYALCLSIDIPLPCPNDSARSLTEQMRIADILDKADAIRRKRREAMVIPKQILDSEYLHLFGQTSSFEDSYEMPPLDRMAKRIVVGPVGPTSHGYRDSGVPFLRTQNVRPLWVDSTDIKYVSDEFHGKLRKSQVSAGDVLISRVGVNRGMAAVVPPELDGANCANIIVVTPGDGITPEFLAYTLNASHAQSSLLGASVGSAQGVINVAVMKRWNVPTPPIEKQIQFSSFTKSLGKLAKSQFDHSEACESLFCSLIQRAFRGEL